MPNWCNNRLQVTGNDFEVSRFVKENQGEDCPLSFNASVPEERNDIKWWIPAEKADVDGPVIHTPKGDFKFDWYNWRLVNWGTKWDCSDVCMDADPGCATYDFSTAWCAPVDWVRAIVKKYPTLSFSLTACEPGNDYLLFMEGEDGEYSMTQESYSDVLLTPEKKRAEVLRALEDEGLNPDEYDIERIIDECEFVACEDLSDIYNSDLELWDCDFEEFKK